MKFIDREDALLNPEPAAHMLFFYEGEELLQTLVASFLGAGLSQQGCALALATPAHLEAIDEGLRANGIDPQAARARGDYHTIDAGAALSEMQTGQHTVTGLPDSVLRVVRDLHEQAGPFRVYGELVDLLARDGFFAEACQVEQDWTRLCREHPFPALCGYRRSTFRKPLGREDLEITCGLHSYVLNR